jgi:protein involved in polysaccharide export with SLBB domain
VLGRVRNPGAFDFRPGMIVLHALALAGGLEKSPATFERISQLSQEQSRADRARNKLIRLLPRKALLEATSTAGSPTVPTELSKLVTASEAKKLIDAAARSSKAQESGHRGRVNALQEDITARKAEIDALQKQSERVKDLVAAQRARAKNVERLLERGTTTKKLVLDVKRELLESESQQSNAFVMLTNASQRLRAREEDLAQLQVDQRSKAEVELAALKSEIDEAQAELDLSTRVSTADRNSQRPVRDVTYVIVRRNGDAIVEMPGSETSDLEPGDVVRIEPSGDTVTSFKL